MEKTLQELAEAVGGETEGDGLLRIKGVAAIKEAGPGDITFIANMKYIGELASTRASAVIAAPGINVEGKPCLRAKNPYLAFAKVLTFFAPKKKFSRGVMDGADVSREAYVGHDAAIYRNVFVEADAKIGDRTVLYPGVYVGEGSSVGADCIIYPNVVIREGVKIGDRVIIHGGTVIGGDGFGYAPDGGKHFKIPQIGGVVIEDDVEIGSNAAIDRGALGDTIIRRGTKIDNLVQIAHNVMVGEDSIIVAQTGISGSTELGHHVVLAGQVGLVGHIKIGDGVQVGAQSGVMNDLEAGQVYTGSPAFPHMEFLKMQAALRKLPELRKRVMEMEKKLEKYTRTEE
ncbi:MAG: UDP-3-O-(3-hydroxymyristoyl)glucosamine N-acyltransferase [Nitrospirota bacterium]